MLTIKEKARLIKSLLSNLQILKVSPSVILYLIQYMGKFRIINRGGHFILHSHLPPINSKAYTRFIDEHLIKKTKGPSHAQIGITNACPQNCVYCYNKKRTGKPLDTATIKQAIKDLKKLGVFWLGLTGGEPLMNKDIIDIVGTASDSCAVKLFTTGCNLTSRLAKDLRNAGLYSVAVSLDHWLGEEHDRSRNYNGAYNTALKAIDIFRNSSDMHVSVSAVLSNSMIKQGNVEEFLEFLIKLGIDEAWLSETKPSSEAFWNDECIINEDDRLGLIRLQDNYNRIGRITVNYLGHFESGEHFGCNAGYKMIYIDAFGEVSPCVFIPCTFGNIKEKSVQEIWDDMTSHFPSERSCFINKNYKLLEKYYQGVAPIDYQSTLKIISETQFGSLSRFSELQSAKS
jgi:MoaA/NifB/PqqE/SkfB family radical SAM enzyme